MTTASLQSIRNTEPWVEDALCAQVDVGDAFFVDQGGTTKPAKDICAACSVVAECLKFALDNNEKFGIWGGLSERERHALKRANPADPGHCNNGHDIAEVGVLPSGYCRKCHADRYERYVARRREGKTPAAQAPHGTRSRYRAGCRCDPCGGAERQYQQSRPPRKRALSLSKGGRR